MAAAIFCPLFVGAAWSAAPPPMEVLAALHAQDARAETVGYRLATAAADLCPGGGRDPGFSVHTLEQYGPPYRAAAAASFGLDGSPGVLSVAPGSPAAAAGLQEGDALLAVGGLALPEAAALPQAADFARTAVVQQAIRRAFAGGRAALSIRRQGRDIALAIDPAPACPSLFQVVPDAQMNGAADGDYVQVSAEMAALARSDDELAAALGHELSHNILGHKARLDALHVDRGLLSAFGRNARLIRQTEAEADRLSIYLMARAGYAPAGAMSFWERFRRALPPLSADPTHPAWTQRLRAMRQEADRVAAGGPMTPLPPDLAQAVARRWNGAPSA